MKLTQEQIDHFNQEGWLFLPELFNPEETSFLAREAEGIYAANRPEVWREKSGAPRTAFAAHLYNEAFGVLGAHPRMIDPIEQIFGEPVYMHQFKINAKSAFTGDVWQWHQDYGTWKRDDGMPEPRAMNIAIFLDEVMPINGPLMLVPRSQSAGDLQASHDLATTSYPLWTLDEETVTRLVEAGRHRRTHRKARRHADVPRQSRARLGRQHHALPAQDRLSDAERGLELHPQADAARLHRPSRLRGDRDRGGRRAGAARPRASRSGGVVFSPSFRGSAAGLNPESRSTTSGFRVRSVPLRPGMTTDQDPT